MRREGNRLLATHQTKQTCQSRYRTDIKPLFRQSLMPAATLEKTGAEPEGVMWGTSLETGQWKEPVATNFTPVKATLASPLLPPVDFRTYTPISVFILDEYDGAYSICAIERFRPARTQHGMDTWEAVNEGENRIPYR